MDYFDEEVDEMRGDEIVRMILDLRGKGWSDTDIVNHILTIEGHSSCNSNSQSEKA